MWPSEQVQLGADRHPAEPEDEACVVTLTVDDVLPLVRRMRLDHELEAVVLVPARVVLLEAGELPDDPYVFETRLLGNLAENARFQLLVRLQSSGWNLGSRVGVLRIVEHEQLRLPVADPRD